MVGRIVESRVEMKHVWILFAFLIVLACQSDKSTTGDGQLFTVRVGNENFTMFLTDPATIQLAIDNFAGKNSLHPSGKIALGHGGFNRGHGWHYVSDTIQMVEVSAEVCDGLPSYVDANTDAFLAVGYCPWAARVTRRGY
jgi:hypothetical protein